MEEKEQTKELLWGNAYAIASFTISSLIAIDQQIYVGVKSLTR